jgi:hypothetical protein
VFTPEDRIALRDTLIDAARRDVRDHGRRAHRLGVHRTPRIDGRTSTSRSAWRRAPTRVR